MARLRLVLRLLLAAVFVFAAYMKLKESYLVFAMSIDSYQLLPEWAVLLVARTLPWFELLLGLWLASGVGLRWAGLIASLQLAVFFAAMFRSHLQGLGIDCGCFGTGEPLTVKTLVRDGFLTFCAILLTFLAFRASRAQVSMLTADKKL